MIILSKLYETPQAAEDIRARLLAKGFPVTAARVVSGDDTKALASRLEKADIAPATAKVYASAIAKGNAALVVCATYKPLGAARIARKVLSDSDTIDIGDQIEDRFVKDRKDHAPSVLQNHPRFLTHVPAPEDRKHGPITAMFGFRTLSKSRRKNSAIPGGRLMTEAMPMLKTDRKADSAMRGGRFMSKAFWPMPLVSDGERRTSVIRGGGTVLSRAFGWPTTMDLRK